MRVVAIALVLFFCVISAHAQEAVTPDTTNYTPPDSLRVLDSAYRARRAMLDRWVREQHRDAHVQQDFMSLYLSYGGYLQILPRDLNQFFAERVGRPDPKSDRDNYGTVDRAFLLGAQAQLGQTWGIYTEYGLLFKFFNTEIDSLNLVEDIDLVEHSFVVGGMYVIYTSPFYRLRVNGGIGGVFALVSESEETVSGGSLATRKSSAVGYQSNFDVLNDFRIMPKLSFTLDLLLRSVSTGTFKTSNDKSIDVPFGRSKTTASLSPSATSVMYGFAAGLVYYF